MGIVDFILNLAGLLLWINWRALRFDPLKKRTPATLMGTLRPAAPQKFRRWHLLLALAGLLVLRALFYWQIGPAMSWAGRLDLGVTTLFFRNDSFVRIFLFSIFSFGLMLGIFYLWLLLLSILNGPEPIHRFVKMFLGAIDDWPRGAKLFLPFAVAAILWWMATWLFAWLQIIPPPVSAAQRIEAAALIGAAGYLPWKLIIAALLVLHLLNSYIYFGKHPFWNYVNVTAQTLLKPLRKWPWRIGRLDFAPVVEIALVFFLAEIAEHGLMKLYGKLPF